MYKKEQFDITVNYKNLAMAKIGILDILMVSLYMLVMFAVFFPIKNFYKLSAFGVMLGIIILFLISIGAIFLRIYFYKRKDQVVLGLNKDGVYLYEYGFVPWNEVKDVVIEYDLGYRIKRRALFFVPTNFQKAVAKMPFFKRIRFKWGLRLNDFTQEDSIPGIYEFYVQEPLENILAEIGEYVVNLDK